MSKRKSQRNRSTILGALLLIILAAVAYYLGIDLDELLDLSGDSTPPVTEVESGAEWYDIYFTNPTCPPEEERSGGIDEIIADDIRQAELRVDMAAFDFDSEPMTEALIELEEQGIPVRMVTDTDNGDLPSIRQLRRNGISVVEDERSALMHNKFVVIDGRFVWMGSMNFTSNGVYCNNNNIVRFDLPELAANYTAEMDEMYDERTFGPRSADATPNEQIRVNDIRLENYFAPEKELAPIIAQTAANAQEEILFMAFSFTEEQIGEAMLARADAGITVSGVYETTGSDTIYSYYPTMRDAGLDNMQVRQDGNSRIMHHKVIIIDRQTVIFGSFNFSASANESNDENIVIMHDPTFTSFFVEEFNTVWAEAEAE